MATPGTEFEGVNGSMTEVDPVTRLAQLAWVIGSPPLLNHVFAPHAALTAEEAAQWWAEWQPHSPPSPQPNGRLGSDFEQLWQYWLRDHPRWQLLAHNLPIREQNRTLGELDLLVRDSHSGEQEHWELAVKFYLGYGDLDQPASWHGPQFRDRLDHKLVHLRDEQLCWKDRPLGQAALVAEGLQPVRARAIVKGRLCYPLSSSDGSASFAADHHQRGLWATVAEWQQWLVQQPDAISARPLLRTEWLAARADSPHKSFSAFLAEAPVPGQRPLALRMWNSRTCWPMVFVVPNDWPARAAAHQRGEVGHDAGLNGVDIKGEKQAE